MQQPDPEMFRTAQLLRRCLNLMNHSATANDTAHQLVQEIQSWGETLDRAVEASRRELQSANQSMATLATQVRGRVQQSGGDLRASLDRVTGTLNSRADELQQVLASITRIGQTVRMLALNATIEAARAGEAGRGFAVVSGEVRNLAQETLKSAEQAAMAIELTDLQNELSKLTEIAERSMSDIAKAVEQTNATLVEAVTRTLAEVDAMAENNRVLWATLNGVKEAADRVRNKDENVRGLLLRSLDAWSVGDQRKIEALLRSCAIQTDPHFDRLSQIKARGVVRVAIEPDFKGLSFRDRGAKLRGLDVEYIEAFAKWLGVKAELVEHPWDLCTELLHAGRKANEAEVDVMWSALAPNARWRGVAYSEPYTYLRYSLARRAGDQRIRSMEDLQDKVLGCINDPAGISTLEAVGFRWAANANKPGGKVRLANLIAFTDQSRIHDCLADGTVDAFAVDKPIYFWACTGSDSPWRGKIELLPEDLVQDPWYYAVGVADEASSYSLLKTINSFIAWFLNRDERKQIELRWQGEVVSGRATYRDEPGGLKGERELESEWKGRGGH